MSALAALWRRARARLLIARWLGSHIRGAQTYVDRNGRQRKLGRDHLIKAVTSTDDLWVQCRSQLVWGDALPTMDIALRDLVEGHWRERPLRILFDEVDGSGSWSDHLARIALLAIAIQSGLRLPPLVLGEDGELIDGYHRLVAYKSLGTRQLTCLLPESVTMVSPHNG